MCLVKYQKINRLWFHWANQITELLQNKQRCPSPFLFHMLLQSRDASTNKLTLVFSTLDKQAIKKIFQKTITVIN
uniref:Ubiquitin-protein ligase, putative n=1 Tax=Arundo donax TaxID=35708 RepID=A0A0A9DMS3_ARUDO